MHGYIISTRKQSPMTILSPSHQHPCAHQSYRAPPGAPLPAADEPANFPVSPFAATGNLPESWSPATNTFHKNSLSKPTCALLGKIIKIKNRSHVLRPCSEAPPKRRAPAFSRTRLQEAVRSSALKVCPLTGLMLLPE